VFPGNPVDANVPAAVPFVQEAGPLRVTAAVWYVPVAVFATHLDKSKVAPFFSSNTNSV